MYDISGVFGIMDILFDGIGSTFIYLDNLSFGSFSLLDISIATIISSIIFTIVFAYVRSRLSNPYTLEKRKK